MHILRANTDVDIHDFVQVDARPKSSLFGQTINDVTPLIGGTADRGCVVLISMGGAVFGAIASGAGEWSLDTRIEVPLCGHFDLASDGCKKLVVTAIDAAGRSQAVEGVFTVLTASPEIPTLATVRILRHSPLLYGQAEPGSLVSITFAGANYLTTADNNGAWSLDAANQEAVSGGLVLGADGRKEVGLVCTDVAGNTSKGRSCLVLQTSGNMSHLAVAAVPRSSGSAVGFPLLVDTGHAWLGRVTQGVAARSGVNDG